MLRRRSSTPESDEEDEDEQKANWFRRAPRQVRNFFMEVGAIHNDRALRVYMYEKYHHMFDTIAGIGVYDKARMNEIRTEHVERYFKVARILERNQNRVIVEVVFAGRTPFWEDGPVNCKLEVRDNKIVVDVYARGEIHFIGLCRDDIGFVFRSPSGPIRSASLYFWQFDTLYEQLRVTEKALRRMYALPADLHAHILDYAPPWDFGGSVPSMFSQ